MPHRQQRTIAMIRLLTSIGGVRNRPRQGRLPRQIQPDAIRQAYFSAIHPMACAAPRAAFDRVRVEILRMLEHLRLEQGRTDADPGGGGAAAARGRRARERDLAHARSVAAGLGAAAKQGEVARASDLRAGRNIGAGLTSATHAGRRAGELVDQAAREFASNFEPRDLRAVVKHFGQRTSDFQREQLDKQVRAAIGVPFSAVEKPVRDHLESFAARNVDLIKTVPERYFDRLRSEVEDAFESGIHPETLAAHLEEAYEISENDALRIARDQIGKLAADVNQSRQEAMGLTGYIWRGSNDNRERESHRALEGEHCEWDDPPMGGGTDETETGHPGDGIQCRCEGEPDFTPLLGEDAAPPATEDESADDGAEEPSPWA